MSPFQVLCAHVSNVFLATIQQHNHFQIILDSRSFHGNSIIALYLIFLLRAPLLVVEDDGDDGDILPHTRQHLVQAHTLQRRVEDQGILAGSGFESFDPIRFRFRCFNPIRFQIRSFDPIRFRIRSFDPIRLWVLKKIGSGF